MRRKVSGTWNEHSVQPPATLVFCVVNSKCALYDTRTTHYTSKPAEYFWSKSSLQTTLDAIFGPAKPDNDLNPLTSLSFHICIITSIISIFNTYYMSFLPAALCFPQNHSYRGFQEIGRDRKGVVVFFSIQKGVVVLSSWYP